MTAVSVSPIASPTDSANGPLRTKATVTSATSSTMVSVTAICSGRSFQKDRPSSTP